MALLDTTFVTDNEEDIGFDLIPDGKVCTVIIKNSEIKTTRAGNGEYIKIECEVIGDEDFNGRKIWHNFNVVNPNEKAVQIGRGQLKRLNQILGLTELKDTAELHGQPFRVLVGIQKGTGDYEGRDNNTIKKFLPAEEEESSGGSGDPWQD